MANRPAKITQAELTRILKAHRDAGMPVARTEIDRNGNVVVICHEGGATSGSNPWDEVTE